MKLSAYAKKMGVSYRTAWNWWKAGKLLGRQMASGTILVEETGSSPQVREQVAVYTRVSSAENRANLDSQAERVLTYCRAKGYQIHVIVKEVGSGVNDSRPKFLHLLADPTIRVIVVEHKDRAIRFGFRYLEATLASQGRRIEVVNEAEPGNEDLIADLVAIVYSFAARLYGQRRAKRKTVAIQHPLESEEDNDAIGGTTPH
jgi:putative resolvase